MKEKRAYEGTGPHVIVLYLFSCIVFGSIYKSHAQRQDAVLDGLWVISIMGVTMSLKKG